MSARAGVYENSTEGHFAGLNAKTIGWVWLFVGLVVSGYLSYARLTHQPVVCEENGTFNCGVVQSSDWATMGGIPVAWMGLVLYSFLAGIWLLERRVTFLKTHGRLVLFAITLPAWAYSMWLVYVQVSILDALCPWCLIHEANITLLLGVIVYRLWYDLR